MTMTLSQFVKSEVIGQLLYPEGLPSAISPPDWPSEGDTEVHDCQRRFFLRVASDIPAIEMDDLARSYNCLGFMHVEEARDWLPLWMCCSVYACQIELDYWGEIAFKVSLRLMDSFEAGNSTVPHEAVIEFYRQAGNGCDFEFVEAINKSLGFDLLSEELSEEE